MKKNIKYNILKTKGPSKVFLKNLVISLIALFTTSCEEIEQVGRKTDSTILYILSQLGNWSMLWLIPPLIIYFLIARDRDEMRETWVSGWTFSGRYESLFTKVPTGRIIKGDPEFGRLLGILWVVFYPIGYWYYILLTTTQPQIGSNIEGNIFMFFILIPAIIITLVGIILYKVLNDKENSLFKILIDVAKYTVGFCFINMVCWIIVTYVLK